MEAAGGVATSTSVSRLPAFFSSINSKPSIFVREQLHLPSSQLTTHQVVHSLLLKSISVSDGNRKNRPFRRNYAMDDRSSQEDERRMPRSSSPGRCSNQKRLLTLFKRIETSISEEKAKSTNEKDSTKSSKASNASVVSVLEALQQSGRPVKGKTQNEDSDSISKIWNRASKTEKEPSLPDPQPVTRPPSNFMKKSPIPSLSTSRISSIEQTAVESPEGGVDEELLELEKMKLTELKELAKARGIKGYSKLKKTELVDLLSSQPKS